MFYSNKRKGLPSFCINHHGAIYQDEVFIALFIDCWSVLNQLKYIYFLKSCYH